ncbi:MAG TPA: hypothetical protein VGP83_01410 [Pyrinomonadaceae bacterium]|jgi:hypothetical protein|nr:hypothetical protein [Pyrinomonadaceae bacterium]
MSELFEKFEVNRESRWKVLTRLIGASVALHLICVALVVYVPALREGLNIGALIANTKFVDKPYDATQIGDNVQLVQLSEKFRYPDGYFALEAQIEGKVAPQIAPANDPFAPRIISQASKEKNVDPEASPSPRPDASASASGSPGASASPNAAVAQASPSPSTLTPEEAQKGLEKSAAENDLPLPAENEINKQVLRDFANYANDLKTQGKLDFNKPFEIVIDAELDEKGKLKNPRVTKKSGDENLVDLFRKMVAALNDSGFLIYLQPITKDNPNASVRITVKQGETEVLASVESEVSSSERAESLAKVLNTALYFGAGSRAGHDEEILMKNTSASPDGKRVVVNFSMPRQSVVEMLQKQLKPGV